MINQLKNLGLTENEAKVYLAMLELGPAPVAEIAQKAGINRPTAYFQIESLKKAGLASTQNKAGKELVLAESPDQLESIVGREAKLLEEKRSELKSILPELQVMFNLGDEKPVVRYFEGMEGLLRMQEEFLKSKEKKLIGISSLDALFKIFPNHSSDYSDRRIKRKIHSRLIYTYSKGPILKPVDKPAMREAKYVKPGKLNFNADITVFDNKVAIAALSGGVSGTIIENKEIANSFKSLLEMTWGMIK